MAPDGSSLEPEDCVLAFTSAINTDVLHFFLIAAPVLGGYFYLVRHLLADRSRFCGAGQSAFELVH